MKYSDFGQLMMQRDAQFHTSCREADISAYLDGELAPQAELELESHFVSCAECTRMLNEQKSLLLALDASLDEPAFELPADFSKAVVASAESRVSGLRRPKERFIAALVCITLFVFSAFAIGGTAGGALRGFGAFIDAGFAVASAAGHFVFDVSLGTAVIFRSLFSSFIAASPAAAFLYAALFFGAVFLFSRLFFRQSGT